MFCDLVGSTPLSGRYDPEDLREVLDAYQRCVADTVDATEALTAEQRVALTLERDGVGRS